MTYLTIFEITTIIVIITDLSGITDHIKLWISDLLTKGRFITKDFTLTILTCSLCQSFWVNLLYIILTKNFSVPVLLFVLLCAFFTPVIGSILWKVRDFFAWLLNKINFK